MVAAAHGAWRHALTSKVRVPVPLPCSPLSSSLHTVAHVGLTFCCLAHRFLIRSSKAKRALSNSLPECHSGAAMRHSWEPFLHRDEVHVTHGSRRSWCMAACTDPQGEGSPPLALISNILTLYLYPGWMTVFVALLTGFSSDHPRPSVPCPIPSPSAIVVLPCFTVGNRSSIGMRST